MGWGYFLTSDYTYNAVKVCMCAESSVGGYYCYINVILAATDCKDQYFRSQITFTVVN